MEDRAAQAASFGPAATLYEKARPEYPAEAVDWLVPGKARRVVDLGAGTGKLTRALVARGLDVTAVDPSEGMLAELGRVLPGVPRRLGSAEHLPLPAAAADLVLVAQAWHWVDAGRAVPEIARVLAPGGRLGLVWNVRDERADWVAQLGGLLDLGTEKQVVEPAIGPPFGPAEHHQVAWTSRLTPDEVVALAGSRSYVILLPPAERAALLDRVRALLATHPDTAGRAVLDLPYVTYCTRADLPQS